MSLATSSTEKNNQIQKPTFYDIKRKKYVTYQKLKAFRIVHEPKYFNKTTNIDHKL